MVAEEVDDASSSFLCLRTEGIPELGNSNERWSSVDEVCADGKGDGQLRSSPVYFSLEWVIQHIRVN